MAEEVQKGKTMKEKVCKRALEIIFMAVVTLFLFGMTGVIGAAKTQAAETVDSGSCGVNLTWALDDEGLLTVNGEGEITKAPWLKTHGSDIKSVILSDGVTSIGESAFEGCSNLTSVELPDSVTSIGRMAFKDCSSMASVELPNNLTSIAYRAFYGCNSLTNIVIPGSVTSIGQSAFNSCSSLESVKLSDNIQSLESWVFEGCSSLASIELPNGLKSIGTRVFHGCSSLTSISIPENVTTIGQAIFSDCSKLSSIEVAPSNKKYDSRDNCNAIVESSSNRLIAGCNYTTIPDSIKSIGKYAFYECKNLTSIEIPDGVTRIEDSAFEECSSLASVGLPNGLTTIGAKTLYNCTSLTSIFIPASVSNIGSKAVGMRDGDANQSSGAIDGFIIYGVSGSKAEAYAEENSITFITKKSISATVTFKVQNGSWNDGTTEDKEVPLSGYEGDTLKLKSSDIPGVGNYPNDTYKTGSWDETPDSETEITEDKTYTYTYAKKDLISATVTFKVQNGSWNDGTTIDKTVTLNGYEGDALKLKSSDIPGVGNAPSDTYKAGSWDETPDSETEITEDTTYTYTYAKKDLISATVTFKVQNGSWNDGTTIDKTVTLNGYEGDALKLKLSDIPGVGNAPSDTYKAGSWDETPDSETEITGDTTYTYTYAKKESTAEIIKSGFCGGNLTWTYDSTGLLTISGNGYMDEYIGPEGQIRTPWEKKGVNKKMIVKIVIESGVSSIGDLAFSGCSSLTSIELPNSLITIRYCAFSGCSSLTSITIPNSTKYIGEKAFINCSRLKSIELPNSVVVINDFAFSGCSSLTSIELPSSLESIGKRAFSGCSSLTSIELPSSVRVIGIDAFADCGGLQSIKVDSFNSAYDSRNNCNAIIDTKRNTLIRGCCQTVIPENVICIGDYAFSGCSDLTSITIPNSVWSIYDHAFSGCSGLTSITIPGGWDINGSTFSGCSSLTSITIPNSIDCIVTDAFKGCSALKDVFYEGTNKNSIEILSGNTDLLNATWHYNFNPSTSCIVSFETNGGTAIKTQVVESGKTVVKPDNPRKDNYGFGSWYADSELKTKYDFTAPVTGNITIYAKWLNPITAAVTFKVVNGSWNDGSMEAKTVTLSGYEGDTLKLKTSDIPGAGNYPGETYKAGSWDVTPGTTTSITGNTTYTYTYAKKNVISAAVTFKVVNGSWNDGSMEAKTVTLSGYEGDTLKLKTSDIPGAGNYPGETYKAGSWDVTPGTTTSITGNTTYTYTYAKKNVISAAVTFKVVNGSWNDGSMEAKTVTLSGYEGDTLKLKTSDIPGAGNYPGETYKAGSWDVTPGTTTSITGNTTYTYTYAKKNVISAAVTFKVVNGSWNDGSMEAKTVTLSGYEGDTLKLKTSDIPGAGNYPGETYKAGSWDVTPGTTTSITGNTTYTYTYAKKNVISAAVTFKVVNGSWNDGSMEAKTVTLSGYEGDTLKLKTSDIPGAGNYPGETYKAGSWDVTPGTTTSITGNTTYTYTYAKNIVSHKWDNGIITKKATCTKEGEKTYTCSECNETRTETIPATGHKWDKGVVTKAPTATSTGVRTYTCTVCKETKTESIPKITKKANPLKLTVTKKIYKKGELKKKKSFKIGVKNAQGKVTYTLDKKAKKAKIKVSKKGKVTVPKNCKPGKYKITVKAKGNANYNAGSKVVAIVVKKK